MLLAVVTPTSSAETRLNCLVAPETLLTATVRALFPAKTISSCVLVTETAVFLTRSER
jgi:hypothetical protein